MKTLVEQFKAARRAATPLLAVETPDPAATIVTLVTALNGKNPPVLQWDIVRGLTPLNDAGKKQIAAFGLQPDSIQAQTINPVETLTLLTRLSPDCVVFIHNAHRFVENEGVAQGIWNLRDVFKGKTNALVLLAPTIALPAELERDVIVLDEPLPDDVQLSAIAES